MGKRGPAPTPKATLKRRGSWRGKSQYERKRKKADTKPKNPKPNDAEKETPSSQIVSLRPRPEAENGSQNARASFLPPKPTNLNGVAAEVWKYLEPLLDRIGVLETTDFIALQILCEVYKQWYDVNEWLDKNSMMVIVRDKHGNVKSILEPPQVRQRTKLQDQLIKLLREFGLSPSSRAGLDRLFNPDEPPQDDSIDL